MSRTHEPDRATLPPPQLHRAELAQSRAFEDRTKTGKPAETFLFQPDGTITKSDKPGDARPANDTDW